MQTFLPYPDFTESARVLDRQRLGKQRVETMQITKALLVPGAGWSNHPATRMWRGHEGALLDYQIAVCTEWTNRGYKDSCLGKTTDLAAEHGVAPGGAPPPWLGDEAFHLSHRSNLVRKGGLYPRLWPDVPADLPYVWPEP